MFSAISNLFGYLLNFLYHLVNNNFGFAIILFSVLLRIILLPITIKQQNSMKKTNAIQGQVKALQVKYKNNPEMLNKETMELYKREKISPFSGCLSAIAQIIIILSVFYLVSQPLTYMLKANDSNPELKAVVDEYKKEINENNNKPRYIEIVAISKIRNDYNNLINNKYEQKENDTNQEYINNESSENTDENKSENFENNKEDIEKRKEILGKLNINMDFLGLDLSKVPNENLKDYTVYIIPVLYVISSFISIKLTTNAQNKMKNKETNDNKTDNKNDEIDTMSQMSKSMTYFMPIMTLSIAFIAPLGLALYWFVSNVLMILERVIIDKITNKKEE